MTTENKNIDDNVRIYFLEQGKNIGNINDILNSNLFTHHLKKWVSVLVEIVLYLLFIFIIIAIISVPSDPLAYTQQLNESVRVHVQVRISELTYAINVFKVITIIASIPLLGMTYLLRRNRKKSILIREAFSKTEEMKSRFNEAVKTLNL